MGGKHGAVPILPCTDLARSEAFYARLGFGATAVFGAQGYRILHDREGASLHLARVQAGSVSAAENVYGVYLYSERVEELACVFGQAAELKPWGVREFAVIDPDGTLIRIGWPE